MIGVTKDLSGVSRERSLEKSELISCGPLVTVTVTVTVTICGDACPLSCASAEAYKLAQCRQCRLTAGMGNLINAALLSLMRRV